MDSREKVLNLRHWLGELRPADEEEAQQLQLLATLAPLALRAMPADPAELDRYLRTAAWAAVKCRSDDASVLQLWEVNEEGAWAPVEVEG